MAWDFETDPDFQRELDWVDEFVREEVEPLDFVIAQSVRPDGPDPQGADPAAAGEGEGARAVGLPPRPRARRPGLRPGEARRC